MSAWTDSTIVLSWLTTEQKYFRIFVTNRIAKIHQLIPHCTWSHVTTSQNSADPASRGLLPSALLSCTIYWTGPSFLMLPEDQWPESKFTKIYASELPEYKPMQRDVLLVTDLVDHETLLHRFSSMTRLIRTLAYCFRFISRAKKRPTPGGVLVNEELQHALSIALTITQRKYFSKLYPQLKGRSQFISPPSLAQIAPFLDPYGVVRVGGRLRFSALNEDSKHPILLPKSAHFSMLVIKHYHLSFLHGGPKLIISMTSRKYWILSGRDAIRQYIFLCVRCTRLKAVRPQPFMADLPTSRVQPHRPFLHTGMDYGGPFVIKDNRRRNAKTSKAYLALFICITSKAVHLEIVSEQLIHS